MADFIRSPLVRGPRVQVPWTPARFTPVRGLLRGLGTPASGLAAGQTQLETISANIANAETTSTPEGGAYRRRVAVLERTPDGGVRVARIAEDAGEGRQVYDPGHPDADSNGYVRMPNVDIPGETVDLVVARRVYEANATVFQAAKAMLRRAMEI